MGRRRIVVTGLGHISPVGNTVAEAWANLLTCCRSDQTVCVIRISSSAAKVTANTNKWANDAKRFSTSNF